MKGIDRKDQKGFTLAELLLTVAILVILMAIAIPNVISARRKLRQRALDSQAEVLYIAAQNQITKLRNEGNTDKYAAGKAHAMGLTPSDAEGEKDLYYVTCNDPAAADLLPAGTVDDSLHQHYWVIEYDPEAGSVYAVFYSESCSDYSPSGYNSLRTQKARLKDGARVGYYGGDSTIISDTSVLAPEISIINKEKLTAEISCTSPDASALSFQVTLMDESGHSLTLKYKANGARSGLLHQKDEAGLYMESASLGINETSEITGKYYTLTLVLDDLTSEASRFSSLYGSANPYLSTEYELQAGEKLTITVKALSESSLVESGSCEASANSLFGNDTTADCAFLYYGRHLQNLDQETSQVISSITSAVQKSDIHFEEQDDLENGQDDSELDSWYGSYGDRAFRSITNENLISYAGSYTQEQEDGTNKLAMTTIYHLTTDGLQERAGLFAVFGTGTGQGSLTDIHLCQPSVTASGNTGSAGSLAGMLEGNVTISGCRAYLIPADVRNTEDSKVWVAGAGSLGGLIGTISGGQVSMKYSFAATYLGDGSTACAGGLVGTVSSGSTLTVTASYADCYLTAARTGGLVGQGAGRISLNDCYAVGYERASVSAAGLVNASAEVKNSYTAVVYHFPGDDQAEDSQDTPAEDTIHLYSTIPNGTAENVYYYEQGNENERGETPLGTEVIYQELSSADMAARLDASAFCSSALYGTYVYNLFDQGITGSYSYPALLMDEEQGGLPHYGDWEANFEPGSLVYYEVYQKADGSISYGFYGANIDTLTDTETVIGDGYGVVYQGLPEEEEEFTVTYEEEGQEKNKVYQRDTNGYSVTYHDYNYYIYPLPTELVNTEQALPTYYQTVKVTGDSAVGSEDSSGSVTFYYNPHFAKTVTTVAGTAPETIAIRSARQLYSLSRYYETYAAFTAKSTYLQECTIDYTTYHWSSFYREDVERITEQAPIGSAAVPFAAGAAYDGGCLEIIGISFVTDQNMIGMFGYNAGTLKNIVVVTDDTASDTIFYSMRTEMITTTSPVYFGVLAGYNTGTVQNCAAAGYYIRGKGSSGDGNMTIYAYQNSRVLVGGLVGSNAGRILACEADCPDVALSLTYANASVGGLVGENQASGTIRSSYALGVYEILFARGAQASLAASLAGFAGSNRGYISDSYCATALTSSGSTVETYGFAPAGGNITNCQYLDGGTFSYLDTLYSFNTANEQDRAQAVTYTDLSGDYAVTKADQAHTRYASGTQKVASDPAYPYRAVLRDANGDYVHYGDWQTLVNMGQLGILYWEHEEGGSNNGYHVSFLGFQDGQPITGSSLCNEHDDNGQITEYGYGYFVIGSESELEKMTSTTEYFQTGSRNTKVEEKLEAQLMGFSICAYTSTSTYSSSALCMTATDKAYPNGIWTLHYDGEEVLNYTFIVNPFFADSMSVDITQGSMAAGVVLEENKEKLGKYYYQPGGDENSYQIRSIEQLQCINWNSHFRNAVTQILSQPSSAETDTYPYLSYKYGSGAASTVAYIWDQTHDVNGNMRPDGGKYFTPIGTLFDSNGAETSGKAYANIYAAYFSGSYDGNAYSIRNIEIKSSAQTVGLFGIVIGAAIKDVILYSGNGNQIERTGNWGWYCMGGLAGFIAQGTDTSRDTVVENCSVSGYQIIDHSSLSGYGGANIGGLFGMCTVDISKCTAINDITIDISYSYSSRNVRVGGLTGGLHGIISDCYCGGKITDLYRTSGQTNSATGRQIGGIVGGCFVKNSGNMTNIVGTIRGEKSSQAYASPDGHTAAVEIRNSYSYVELPTNISGRSGGSACSVMPVAGNGDSNYSDGNLVVIRNSYYYAKNAAYLSRTQSNNIFFYVNGRAYSMTGNTSGKTNYSIYASNFGLTLAQMSGEQLPSSDQTLLEALNGGSETGAFGMVTTIENGVAINGKYSYYPGTRKDLIGKNYPFPCILKQTDLLDSTREVYVHYGEWPVEGLTWAEARVEMDLIEHLSLLDEGEDDTADDQKSSTTANTKKDSQVKDPESSKYLTSEEVYTLVNHDQAIKNPEKYSYDKDAEEGTENQFVITYYDGEMEETDPDAEAEGETQAQTSEVAEVLRIVYEEEEGSYKATVRALKTGTTVITASLTADGQTWSDEFTIKITADLDISAALDYEESDPAKIQQLGDGTILQMLDSTETYLLKAGYANTQAETEEEADTEEESETDQEDASEAESSDAFDLAAYMTWEVVPDNTKVLSIDGPQYKISAGDSGGTSAGQEIFNLTAEAAASEVTLTISGTLQYEGVEYLAGEWLILRLISPISWKKEASAAAASITEDTITIPADSDSNESEEMASESSTEEEEPGSGTLYLYYLFDPSARLRTDLGKEDFEILFYDDLNSLSEEEGTAAAFAESSHVTVCDSITWQGIDYQFAYDDTAGCYVVPILAEKTGDVLISLTPQPSALADEEDILEYKANLRLTIEEAEPETETESELETESETETETESKSETGTESEEETLIESETEVKTQSFPESEFQSEEKTEVITEPETERETEIERETETESSSSTEESPESSHTSSMPPGEVLVNTEITLVPVETEAVP